MGELLDRPAVPRRNLGRMQTVPGQIRNRLVALDRFQHHLALHSAKSRLHVLMVGHPQHR
jgi:hypothetical protein